MVQTIVPAVSGTDRQRWLRIHTSALVLGSITTALSLTIIGESLQSMNWPAHLVLYPASVILVGWIGRSAFGIGLPYPRSRWQVPEVWRDLLPPTATAAAYGYLLGVGFVTDVVLSAYWILFALTIALGDINVAVVAWTTYAVCRAITMVRRMRVIARTSTEEWIPDAVGLRLARIATVLLLLSTLSCIVCRLCGGNHG